MLPSPFRLRLCPHPRPGTGAASRGPEGTPGEEYCFLAKRGAEHPPSLVAAPTFRVPPAPWPVCLLEARGSFEVAWQLSWGVVWKVAG